MKKILKKFFGKKDENLVDENHLGTIAWTIACWMNLVLDKEKKMSVENYRQKVEKFSKLFLKQEKKRGHIKDFSDLDVKILTTLSIACDPIKAVELSKHNGFDHEAAKAFEKEIGYK